MMASTMYMTVGGVLSEYGDQCELFELLLRFGHRRELSKKLLVLWMWLISRPILPSPVLQSKMIPHVMLLPDPEISAACTAYYLNDVVQKTTAALSQIQMGAATPTPTTPAYIRYFHENQIEIVKGLATLINTGIPALIFDDDLRRTYLCDGPLETLWLRSPFKEVGPKIAAFDDIMEEERSMKFRFDRTHGRDFRNEMVGFMETRFGEGCVQKVVFNDDVNPMYPQMLTGQIVFEEPASYLHFAFNRNANIHTRITLGSKALHIGT